MDDKQLQISKLLPSISSSNGNKTCKNLAELQRFLKNGSFRRQFIENNGISCLTADVDFLGHQQHGEQQQHPKSTPSSTDGDYGENKFVVLERILSCLTKLTTKNKNCINQFVKANGLSILGKLLQQYLNPNCLKNICSLIVNVKEDANISLQLASALVNVLVKHQDAQLTITILRTLWTICSSTSLICVAAAASGFPSAVKLLSSDDVKLAKASLRVLHKFLKGSSNEQAVGLRILQSDGLNLLLALMQRELTESDYSMISDCLYYMIGIPLVRVSAGCTNVIQFCVTELSQGNGSKRFRNAFFSLCLCAMEAMNRNKMRCTGALEKLVNLLGDTDYSSYHFQIVSTFVCFRYDDPSLVVMLGAGLLPNLIQHLEWLLKLQSEGNLDSVSKTLLPENNPFTSPDGAKGPISADGSSPNIQSSRGPFHDVLIILGKLSQTSAIRFMVTRSCINPILKYISIAKYLASQAEKILSRITENPHFFELLLKLGIVQSIYFQLKTGCSTDSLIEIVSQMASSDATSNKLLCFSTDVVSFRGLSKAFSRNADEKLSNEDKMKDVFDDLFPLLAENAPPSRYCVKRMTSLISKISCHAESPFGQGVLTHALLSDVDDIKVAYIMGYCFLCRSPQFQKHIFIDLKGLDLIINLILNSSDDDAKLCNGLLALSGLAKSTGVVGKKRSSISVPKSESDSFKTSSERQTFHESKRRRLSESAEENIKRCCCILSRLFCTRVLTDHSFEVVPKGSHHSEVVSDGNLCRTREADIDFNDKNVCFYLEESVKVIVNRDRVLSASPVFAAMLSDSFVDSSLPFVSLKDVHSTSFVILLHHVFGCSIDLKSLGCDNGCKFDGIVEIKSGADLFRESMDGGQNAEEAPPSQADADDDVMNASIEVNDEGTIVKEEQENLVRNGGNIQNDFPVIRSNNHEDRTQHFDPTCIAKVMSDEQKLCLVIDLLRISDRFLMDKLRTTCEEYLTDSLSDETVLLLYMEALSCQARILSDVCAKYILSEMEHPASYLKTAVTLFRSVERERVLDDLKNVLQLQIHQNQIRKPS